MDYLFARSVAELLMPMQLSLYEAIPRAIKPVWMLVQTSLLGTIKLCAQFSTRSDDRWIIPLGNPYLPEP